MRLKDSYYDCVIHLSAQSAIGKQFWVSSGVLAKRDLPKDPFLPTLVYNAFAILHDLA